MKRSTFVDIYGHPQMRLLRWLSSDRAGLIFCLDEEFVFSAPLALGWVSGVAPQVGTAGAEPGVGKGTAGMWVCVHPWSRAPRTEIELLVLSDA